MYKDVEKRKEYDKKYYEKNKEKRKKQQAKYYEENKKHLKQEMSKYGKKRDYKAEYIKYKDKIQIRNKSKYKYAKFKNQCSICGITENLELHHIQYTRDDIVVVCRVCHCKIHRR